MVNQKSEKNMEISDKAIEIWIGEHVPNYHLFGFCLKNKIFKAVRNNFSDILEGRTALQDIIRPYKKRQN